MSRLHSLVIFSAVVACSEAQPPPPETPSGELTAHVVFTDASAALLPAAGAVVTLEGGAGAARTDAAGAFTLKGLTPGDWSLRIAFGAGSTITHGGRFVAHLDGNAGQLAAPRDLGQLTLHGVGSLAGKVTRAGAKVTGLPVFVVGAAETRAGEGGYVVSGLIPGTYALAIVDADALVTFPTVDVKGDGPTTYDLELDAGTRETRGQVSGSARVVGGLSPSGVEITVGAAAATAGPDGTFTLRDLPAGIYTVIARRADLRPAVLPFLAVAGTTLVLPMTLDKGAGCGLAGTAFGTEIDADADGVADVDEAGVCRCLPGALDADHDGLCDSVDRDLDDDGRDDAVDNCPGVKNADQADADHDGKGDACDDGDSDGIMDPADNCPAVANTDQADADHDGIGDLCEDGDNDGTPDVHDNCPLVANEDQDDGDGDHVGDTCDLCPADADTDQANGDGDAFGDACDLCPAASSLRNLAGFCADFDSDGKVDAVDVCPHEPDPAQTDTDGDHVGDACDVCPQAADPDQADDDQDGRGDACDPDTDLDGVDDDTDNCDAVANPDQLDTNGDHEGDACDDDDDGDGTLDTPDNCPLVPNADQADRDHDGKGNACDPDTDLDGVEDDEDNCAALANADQANLDGDAKGDLCDLDDDGDGDEDLVDNCPRAANADQLDTDQDGLGDVCDDCPTGPCTLPSQWSVGGATGVTSAAGSDLVTLGQPVEISVQAQVGSLGASTVTWASRGRPAVRLGAVSGQPFRTRFVPDAIGQVEVEAKLTLGAQSETHSVKLLVVHDPSRAMFFDPVAGVDSNDGSPATPKRDALAYANAITSTTVKRDLYVKAGTYTNAAVAMNDATHPTGDGLVRMIGGYGPGWARDPGAYRTVLDDGSTYVVSAGPSSDTNSNITLDGLVLDAPGAGIVGAKGNLTILNSTVVGTVSSLYTNVRIVNSVIIGAVGAPAEVTHSVIRYTYSSNVAMSSSRSMLESNTRFSFFDLPLTVVPSNNTAFGFEGSVVYSPSSLRGSAWVTGMNAGLSPRWPNTFTSAGARCVDTSSTLTTGTVTLSAGTGCSVADADVEVEFPETAYAVRYDRRLRERSSRLRFVGPEDPADPDGDGTSSELERCPHDAADAGPAGSACPLAPPRIEGGPIPLLTLGTPYTLTLGAPGATGTVAWSASVASGGATVVAGTSPGTFVVTSTNVGPAILQVTATDAVGTSRRRFLLDTLPADLGGGLVFITYRQYIDDPPGTGTQADPLRSFPSTLVAAATASAPITLVYAQGNYNVSLLPQNMPNNLRIYGGFAIRNDGSWRRRLPLSRTYLPIGSTALVIPAATGTRGRLLDGLQLWAASGAANPAIDVQGGPLTIAHSLLVQDFASSSGHTMVRIGANATDVVLTSNDLYVTNASGTFYKHDLVRVENGAAPTIHLNDFRLNQGGSGNLAAIDVEGTSAKGSYVGNRFVLETGTFFAARAVAFRLAATPAFAPTAVWGNVLADADTTDTTTMMPGSTGFDTWGSITALVTGSQTGLAPNVDNPACAGVGPMINAQTTLMPRTGGGCVVAGAQATMLSLEPANGADQWGLGYGISGLKRTATAADMWGP